MVVAPRYSEYDVTPVEKVSFMKALLQMGLKCGFWQIRYLMDCGDASSPQEMAFLSTGSHKAHLLPWNRDWVLPSPEQGGGLGLCRPPLVSQARRHLCRSVRCVWRQSGVFCITH